MIHLSCSNRTLQTTQQIRSKFSASCSGWMPFLMTTKSQQIAVGFRTPFLISKCNMFTTLPQLL